jgi:hypothetical protein
VTVELIHDIEDGKRPMSLDTLDTLAAGPGAAGTGAASTAP